MNDRADIELLQEHLFALEDFVERIAPMLIAASPARPQIEAQLQAWASRETSDQAEVRLGDLAESLLHAMPPAAGT